MASMTPNVFYLKAGDTSPAITATLIDQNGVVANLTGATVSFRMTNAFFGNVINKTATIVNATLGQVSYSWQTGDTNDTGTFSCQWYVVFGSGAQESYPQGFYDTVQIDPNLSSGFSQISPSSPLFNTIWNSTSNPTTIQGNNGDFWLNTATNYFFGPKVNGTWPSGFIVNPAGAPLNSFGAPTGNVNMGGYSFSSLAYVSATPSSTTQTALTVNAPSGSTVDVVDIELNSVIYWNVTSAGNLNGIGQLNLSPSSVSLVPLVVNSPSGTTADVADFQINGTTYWKINDAGTMVGTGQLDLSPSSTSVSPLMVNVPSGSSVNIATFQVNGTTAWDITDTGVLAGVQALTVSPTSTTVTPATFNTPTSSTAPIAVFEQNSSPVAEFNSAGNLAIMNGKQIDITGAAASPFIGSASQTYTPTWTSTGTAPSIGTGTLNGYYIKTGRFVQLWIELLANGTTVVGSGNYSWSLPVSATSSHTQMSGTFILDVPGGSPIISTGVSFTNGTTLTACFTASGGNLGASSPVPWTTSTSFYLSLSYESAL